MGKFKLSHIKPNWIAYIATALFVIAKIPHLYYSFYGDESEVYAPAIYTMFSHGPSILCTAIPVEFSRGHPLLFQASCAAWMNLFGSSHFSMHCFALALAVSLAIALYQIQSRIFNQEVATISLFFLLLNQHFFVQSSLLLTDISLTLFALLSLYCYHTGKYFYTGLFLALLFFTKESGLVAIVVMGLDICILIAGGKTPFKIIGYKIISVTIPTLLIAAFFLMQKVTFGWFLFPAHTAMIHLDISNTLFFLRRSMEFLFYSGGIIFVYVLLALISVFVSAKEKNPKYLSIPVYLFFVYLVIFCFSHKDLIFYVFTTVSLALALILLHKATTLFNSKQAHFIRLLITFSLLFLYFSCVNFYEDRYLMPALVFISIALLAVAYDFFIAKLRGKTFYYVVGLYTVIAATYLVLPNDHNSLFDRLDVEQDMVNYFENSHLYDKTIFCQAHTEYVHLIDPKTGFLHSNRIFKATDTLIKGIDFVVFDNIDPDYEQQNRIKKDSAYLFFRRFQKRDAWVDIYKKKGEAGE